MRIKSCLLLLGAACFCTGCDSADPGPRAAFSAPERVGPAPLTVQFTDTSNPGGQSIVSWAWDFGDGTTSTDQNPSHIYEEEGAYNVSLSIVTDQGVERTRTSVAYVIVGDVFARTFGGPGIDDGQDIIATTDGNFAFAGAITPEDTNALELYLAKVNSDGMLLWERRFAGVGAAAGRALIEGDNGDLIVTGFARNALGRNQVFLVRTDADGNERWSTRIGGQFEAEGYDIVRVLEGENEAETFTIAGTFRPIGAFDRDLFLVHVDAEGAELWSARIESLGDEEIRALALTEDGGYLVVGSIAPANSANTDVYAVRTDSLGQFVWAQNYGGAGNDRAYDVIPTEAGYLIAGSFQTLSPQGTDLFLLHIDDDGGQIWSATHGGNGTEQAWGILALANGGYLASGFTTSQTAGAEDALIMGINEAGEELWRRNVGGSGLDILRKAAPLPGGFMLVGSTASSGAGQRDIYLVKTTAEGYAPSDPEIARRMEI